MRACSHDQPATLLYRPGRPCQACGARQCGRRELLSLNDHNVAVPRLLIAVTMCLGMPSHQQWYLGPMPPLKIIYCTGRKTVIMYKHDKSHVHPFTMGRGAFGPIRGTLSHAEYL